MEIVLPDLGSPIKIPLLLPAVHISVCRPVTFEGDVIGEIPLFVLQFNGFFYESGAPVFIGEGDTEGGRMGLLSGRGNVNKPVRSGGSAGVGGC